MQVQQLDIFYAEYSVLFFSYFPLSSLPKNNQKFFKQKNDLLSCALVHGRPIVDVLAYFISCCLLAAAILLFQVYIIYYSAHGLSQVACISSIQEIHNFFQHLNQSKSSFHNQQQFHFRS